MLPFALVIAVFVVLGFWYELKNPAQYEYICPQCGAARTSFIPPRSKRRNPCAICAYSKLVIARSPRGRALQEMFHGSASAERRFQKLFSIQQAAENTPLDSSPPVETAAALSSVMRLVRTGAFPPEEWSRLENLIRLQPRANQSEVIRRLDELYQSHQRGTITRAKFEQEKWAVLSPQPSDPA